MSCSPYFNLNLTTQEMEAKLLSMTDLFSLENDSAKKYDQAFLNQSLSVLNGLINVVKSHPDLYNYPMLVDRFDAGSIGTTEYADFLVATSTPQSTVENINSTYFPYYSNSTLSSTTSTVNDINIIGVVPTASYEYFVNVDSNPKLNDGIVVVDTGKIWEYTNSTTADSIDGFVDSGQTVYGSINTSTSYNTNSNYLSISTMQYLENMNTYYTTNFSSNITGGICGLIPKFQSFLDKLRSVFSFLESLLDIGKLIEKLIDTIKEKLLSIINQLIAQIGSCLGSINSVVNTIKDVTHFFSEGGISSLKDTVKIAIADIASKFEIPQTQTDPFAKVLQIGEAIKYLLYRLCQFTTAIEDFMMAPVNALKSAIANCSQVAAVLTNASNQFTYDALTAGAFRMNDSNITAIREQLGAELNSSTPSSTATVGAEGATPSNYWTSPFTDDEKAMATELVSASPETIRAGGTRAQQHLQFQSQVVNQNDPYPAAGVKELQQSVIIIGIRIAKTLGTKLIINSGYRSPAYNATRPGAAKNSYHMKGLAMDCARSAYGTDFASGERFIKIASQEGAGGIGTYPTFIHIDTGPRRAWTTIAGTPLGHDNARSLHKQDKFRTGL